MNRVFARKVSVVFFMAVCLVSFIAPAYSQSIDAAANWGSGKVFFFKGDEYSRYDLATNKIDEGYPKKIGSSFLGMSFPTINDVLVLYKKDTDKPKAFFFKGDQYIQYDITGNKVDPGFPKPISGKFLGMSFTDIDAVANWGNGKAFFFKGDEYIRYDLKADKIDAGYPKKIASSFLGITFPKIDAVMVNVEKNKAFFFCDDQYARYDMTANKVDPDYPRKTADSFIGLNFTGSTGGGGAAGTQGP